MKAVITSFLALSFLSVNAQTQSRSEIIPTFTHGIGISFQKFEGLNSRIANYPEYKPLKEAAALLHLGVVKEYKQVISDMGIFAASSMSGDRDKRSITIRFACVNANIGYDVLKSESVMLYPLAGLGFEIYQARFFKDNSAVAFDDVLQSPTVQNNIRSVDFKNAFFTYNLGFGIGLTSAKHRGASVGLKAGYTGSFKTRSWRSSEGQLLQNAPTDNLGRFHVSLVLGQQPKFKK